MWGDGGRSLSVLLALLIGTSASEAATDAEARRKATLGVQGSCQVVAGRFPRSRLELLRVSTISQVSCFVFLR